MGSAAADNRRTSGGSPEPWAPDGSPEFKLLWVAFWEDGVDAKDEDPSVALIGGAWFAPLSAVILGVVSLEVASRIIPPDLLQGRTVLESVLWFVPVSWSEGSVEWLALLISRSVPTPVLAALFTFAIVIAYLTARARVWLEIRERIHPTSLADLILKLRNSEFNHLSQNALPRSSQRRLFDFAREGRRKIRLRPPWAVVETLALTACIVIGSVPVSTWVRDGLGAFLDLGVARFVILAWVPVLWVAVTGLIRRIRIAARS